MSFRSRCLTSWMPRWRLCLGALALSVLGACGGDASRVQDYAPTRLAVFGDEHSLLTATGQKYTINTVNSKTAAVDCTLGPIWVQVIANAYGFVFPECNPNNTSPTAAVMSAAVGATVATTRAQVAAYKAANGGTLTNATLVTILAGMHDVLAAYQAFDAGTLTRDAALAQLGTAGTSLGTLVNELTDGGKGARVIYATVPDISYSPYALAEKAAKTDTDRAQLLKDFVKAFNDPYRLAVTNEGAWAALVIVDDMVAAMVKTPAIYALTDVTSVACQAAAVLPTCSTGTLVAGTNNASTTFLWADNLHFSMSAQNRLGSLALFRAQNNPF
jgi:outer membrane lipase/esterase